MPSISVVPYRSARTCRTAMALAAAVGARAPAARAQEPTRATPSASAEFAPPPSATAAVQAAVHRDPPRDARFPGGVSLVAVPSHGAAMRAVFFRAAGPGPHPLLVLLHGFPGAEPGSDLAHAARRAGWHVLAPRYRGAWGSPGAWSWAHVLEDAATAVAWARSDAVVRAYGVDPHTVAVAGHSLGGFAALMTAADDPSIAGAASLAGFNFGAYTADGATRYGAGAARDSAAADWADGAAVLAGTSGRALADEAFARGTAWDLRGRVGALAGPGGGRPLLLVAASDDDVAPPTLHHAPLVAALGAAGARRVSAATLAADHSFADARVALAERLVAWLAGVRAASPTDGAAGDAPADAGCAASSAGGPDARGP